MGHSTGQKTADTSPDTTAPRQDGLRIVACHVEPAAYDLVAAWADRQGHQIVLVVTTPGPSPRTYTGHQEIVATAPHDQDILVTTRLKRAAPLIAATRPDVVLSYTFPLRIPAAVLEVPRLGAVNLHPSPLPKYRGPNPARMVYDGAPTLGATLHRTSAGFDAGPILSCQESPAPADPTVDTVLASWQPLLVAALDEGMERLVAGDPGDLQDESRASYAAPFTPEEQWIDWTWPAETVQRRVTALNLLLPTARALIGEEPVLITGATTVPHPGPSVPGGIMEHSDGRAVVAAADGAVAVTFAAEATPAALDPPGGQVLEREFVSVE